MSHGYALGVEKEHITRSIYLMKCYRGTVLFNKVCVLFADMLRNWQNNVKAFHEGKIICQNSLFTSGFLLFPVVLN